MSAISQAANQDFNLYGKLVKVDRLLDNVADRSFNQNYTTNPWITGWETADITVPFNSTTLMLMLYMPFRIAQGGNGSLAFVEVQYSTNSGVSWTKAGRSSFFGDYKSGNRDNYFHILHLPNISAGTIRFRLAHAVYVLGGTPTVYINPTTGGMTTQFYTQFVAMQYSSLSVAGSIARKIAEYPRGQDVGIQEVGSVEGEVIFSLTQTVNFPNMNKVVGSGVLALIRVPAGLTTVLGPTASTRFLTCNVSYSTDNGVSWQPYGSTSKYGTSGGVNDQMAKYTHFMIPVYLADVGASTIKFKVDMVADTSTTSGYTLNKGLTNASALRASVSLLEFTK